MANEKRIREITGPLVENIEKVLGDRIEPALRERLVKVIRAAYLLGAADALFDSAAAYTTLRARSREDVAKDSVIPTMDFRIPGALPEHYAPRPGETPYPPHRE